MRIVLDTNVLISALAFPGSKPDQIFSRIRRRKVDLFISPFILSELDRVLQQKFRFTIKEADAWIRTIRTMAHLVQPTERITVVTAKDDDNRILKCALAAQAHFLVTGDKKHLLPLGSYHGTKIVAPAQLIHFLEAR